MIEINNKQYLNLEEQVLQNKLDIDAIMSGAVTGVTEARVNDIIDSKAILRNGTNAPTSDISWNDKGIVELRHLELSESGLSPAGADVYKDNNGNVVFNSKILAVDGISANNKTINNVATPTLDTQAANKAYVDSVAGGGGGGSGFSKRSIIQGGTYSTGSLYSEFTGTVDYNESARIIQYTTGLNESFYADQYGDNYINFDISGSLNLSSGGVVHGFISGVGDSSVRAINNVVGNYTDYGYGYSNINLYMPTGEGISGGDDISLTLFLGG